MIEFLKSLEWPGALAVVGSVVTIVLGWFGYLVSIRKKPNSETYHQLTTAEYEKLHTRINEAVERIAENEGDLKEVSASLRSLQKQLASHEQRDIQDFSLVDAKIDRLMDIVVKILQDDKI